MDVSSWGGLTPEDIRRQVGRGSSLVLPVVPAMDMPGVSAVARSLRAALPDDMLVIASPRSSLTVLRLITEEEAARLRPELDRLIADFRQRAGSVSSGRSRCTATTAGSRIR